MPRISGSIEIFAPVEKVYAFCTDPRNLPQVFPKDFQVEVVRWPEQPLTVGAEICLRFERAGITWPWDSVITSLEPLHVFEDVQVHGPMKQWSSRHVFDATPRGTRLLHEVDYELHFGNVGRLCTLIGAHTVLKRIFRDVARLTKEAIERGNT